MEEVSDRHFSALKWMAKANFDLAKAAQSVLDKKYADAYAEILSAGINKSFTRSRQRPH